MPDESDQPATKADISLLGGELKAELASKAELKADIAAVKTELKADIASVKTELTAQINRVAVALVNTQADIREIRHDMATKMSTKDDISRVLSAIDAFAKKSENNDHAVTLHGPILTEVHPRPAHKDHEGRLKTLESARP